MLAGAADMTVVRFGPCRLDFDARQLIRDNQPVHLSPKAFELLRILVAERPRAVSKAELHERIWSGTFVSDDSLNGLVREARAAIGDQARQPRWLRTVHAFGYAFAGLVEPEAAPVPLTDADAVGWLICQGRAVPLVAGENVIGRDPVARLALDSVRVSRRHARVTLRGQAAMLEDLGSRNGTHLNGQVIEVPTPLTDGDEISLGGFTLRFRAAGQPVLTEADE